MSLSKFSMFSKKTNLKTLICCGKKAGPWAFVFSQYHYISISVLLSNDEMLYLVLTWMQLCKLESSNLPDLIKFIFHDNNLGWIDLRKNVFKELTTICITIFIDKMLPFVNIHLSLNTYILSFLDNGLQQPFNLVMCMLFAIRLPNFLFTSA